MGGEGGADVGVGDGKRGKGELAKVEQRVLPFSTRVRHHRTRVVITEFQIRWPFRRIGPCFVPRMLTIKSKRSFVRRPSLNMQVIIL